MFADDVALLTSSPGGMVALHVAFKQFCARHHLTISKKKTKLMVAAAQPQQVPADLEGEGYECVGEFRYLGVQVDRRGHPATVAAALHQAARGSLAALCTHVGM